MMIAVKSSVRIDCGHLPRPFVQVDLVISVLQIQSGELLTAGEFCMLILDTGKRVGIELDCLICCQFVVSADPNLAV